MAARTPLHTYDALSGGKVIPALQGWRADGHSYFECARRLHDEFSIETTPSTVRRWLADLEPAA